ncbi:MAG: PRC-barrel domain-containing protein [Candidatus Aenigmatarchaeota archaeon]
MAVSVKSFSEMVRKDVFTTKGAYCGRVTDIGLDLEKFRTKTLVVDAVKGSFLASLVGDKKGVIVPFQMVQSIGDIVIIKHVMPATVEDGGRSEAAPDIEATPAADKRGFSIFGKK